MTTTVLQFMRRFPDDATCLDHLMRLRYGESLDCPKCGKHGKFHRLTKELAYSCQWCGHHVHPMQGTIFYRSHTPLQKWFYAIYLFTTSRHGVPAKELQRQLGVSYETAWRMGHKIRELMAKTDGDDPLSGHVEADETYVGGKRPGKRGRGAAGKTVVFGVHERGGDILTRVVPNVKRKTLEAVILEKVSEGSAISTDELRSYRALKGYGYAHGTVNHGAGEYVNRDIHVNSLEGFWSRLKNSIRGTHFHVSRKHLSSGLIPTFGTHAFWRR